MLRNLKYSMKFIRRDALAGSVTGLMAVPLTVGICLMSDYPVMTGIYTVIFACIVGYVVFLFRPGNYTGVPGVGAGLAPVLALGVSTFGMENMAFVVMLSAVFKIFVWKYRWERYILRLVPHYLVEGLLAGIGMKIGMKFIPFLYDIEHETEVWLNFEREVVLGLSIVSLILFVILFHYYKKRMPAMPYLIIMVTSVALSFFMPLPILSVEPVPFEFIWPVPHLDGMNNQKAAFVMVEMILFSIMLGIIDVIEQVMSNVAIEKMDPEKRHCDTNNSLLAIWIANLGSSFFGGMTNLDGLAKSTTNTVAGAVTKLSNLFTAAVLLLVVAFPESLSHLPEYSLGVIMVYSGWKMVANIAHTKAEGRYAMMMAGICAVLVFQFGIFEGLLMVLAFHAATQFAFMKKLNKSNGEIWHLFMASLKGETMPTAVETSDLMTDHAVPMLSKWTNAINKHDIEALMMLYDEKAILISPFSAKTRIGRFEIKDLYRDLFHKKIFKAEPIEVLTQKTGGLKIDNGKFMMRWYDRGMEHNRMMRFSLVIKDGTIKSHHSSFDDEGDVFMSDKDFAAKLKKENPVTVEAEKEI